MDNARPVVTIGPWALPEHKHHHERMGFWLSMSSLQDHRSLDPVAIHRTPVPCFVRFSVLMMLMRYRCLSGLPSLSSATFRARPCPGGIMFALVLHMLGGDATAPSGCSWPSALAVGGFGNFVMGRLPIGAPLAFPTQHGELRGVNFVRRTMIMPPFFFSSFPGPPRRLGWDRPVSAASRSSKPRPTARPCGLYLMIFLDHHPSLARVFNFIVTIVAFVEGEGAEAPCACPFLSLGRKVWV